MSFEEIFKLLPRLSVENLKKISREVDSILEYRAQEEILVYELVESDGCFVDTKFKFVGEHIPTLEVAELTLIFDVSTLSNGNLTINGLGKNLPTSVGSWTIKHRPKCVPNLIGMTLNQIPFNFSVVVDPFYDGDGYVYVYIPIYYKISPYPGSDKHFVLDLDMDQVVDNISIDEWENKKDFCVCVPISK